MLVADNSITPLARQRMTGRFSVLNQRPSHPDMKYNFDCHCRVSQFGF